MSRKYYTVAITNTLKTNRQTIKLDEDHNIIELQMGFEVLNNKMENAFVFVFCEKVGENLVDVITGKPYKATEDNTIYNEYYSNDLCLHILNEVSVSEVAQRLKELDKNMIENYLIKMKEVEMECSFENKIHFINKKKKSLGSV